MMEYVRRHWDWSEMGLTQKQRQVLEEHRQGWERERKIQEAVFKPRREFADVKPLTLAQKNLKALQDWLVGFEERPDTELNMTVIFESNEHRVWDKLKKVLDLSLVSGDVWQMTLQGSKYRTKLQIDLGKTSLSEFHHTDKGLDTLVVDKLYIFTPDSAIKTVCLEKRTINPKQS